MLLIYLLQLYYLKLSHSTYKDSLKLTWINYPTTFKKPFNGNFKLFFCMFKREFISFATAQTVLSSAKQYRSEFRNRKKSLKEYSNKILSISWKNACMRNYNLLKQNNWKKKSQRSVFFIFVKIWALIFTFYSCFINL